MLHTTLGLPDASIKAATSSAEAHEIAYELGQRTAAEHMRVTGAGPMSCALFAISLFSTGLSHVERERLCDVVAKDLTLGQLNIDVPGAMDLHASWLAELKLAEQWPEEVWAGAVRGTADGLATGADLVADTTGETLTHSGSSLRSFIDEFLVIPSLRPIASSEADPDSIDQDHGARPAERTGKTTTDLVDEWLNAKGVQSRAERSRQGSSARLFVDAVGLIDAPVTQLSSIGPDAPALVLAAAAQAPLSQRGERARLTHILSFLAYVQGLGVAVPALDWSDAHKTKARS